MMEQEEDVAMSLGNRVALSWLKRLYHTFVASESFIWVAEAYLLHLLGNIIFDDKS